MLENLEFFENLNFIDPFSEKPLIYKKVDENKFMVYSVGINVKDDEAKNLYITGAIDLEKNKDEGIAFCFSIF